MNPPITMRDWERFYRLRCRIFELIHAVDEGIHKSYEGAIDLTLGFDNVWESGNSASPPSVFNLDLYCYLLINGRQKRYQGRTFEQCLDQLEHDMDGLEQEWKEELDEYMGRKRNKQC